MTATETTPGRTRLRRSLLWVPGDDERKLSRAADAGADAVVLDLEDAVVPDRKAHAREIVRDCLSSQDFRGAERLVRINPVQSDLALEDLRVTFGGAPDGFVIPKLRNDADVARVDRALAALEENSARPPGSTGLVLLATETPEAVLNLPAIARASPRTQAMMWASEDLSGAIGARRSRNQDGSLPDVFSFARSACLLAATAYGVDPLDMPFLDFRDPAGLEREAREAADQGFTGKGAIHPAQIETLNRIFVPDPEEVEAAEALLRAAEEAFATGRAAFVYNGSVVDAPHIHRAQRIVERANAAKGRNP